MPATGGTDALRWRLAADGEHCCLILPLLSNPNLRSVSRG